MSGPADRNLNEGVATAGTAASEPDEGVLIERARHGDEREVERRRFAEHRLCRGRELACERARLVLRQHAEQQRGARIAVRVERVAEAFDRLAAAQPARQSRAQILGAL